MTDKELFLQYNMINTRNYHKNNELINLLHQNKLTNINLTRQNADMRWLVLLHGSYNCNLNCIYCENGALRRTYHSAIMDPEIAKQVIQKLGPNIREITWHGGEPLTLPEELLIAVEDERKKYHYDFKVSLQTNLTLLTPEKEKLLKELNIDWGTSFDGIYNNDSRGELSTKALLTYLEKKQIGFIAVTTSKTINSLIENYNYFKKIHVTNMQSCIVRENVIDGTNPFLVENEIAVEKMLEYIKYWIFDTNNPISDSYIIRWIEKLLGHLHTCEDINCVGRWIVVDPLGNITTCGHSGQEEAWCNIKEINSYQDLLCMPQYIKTFTQQQELINTQCKNSCRYYSVCHGGCMGLNYEVSHDYTQLNERNCLYTKALLDGIYELIKNIDINESLNPIFIRLLKENNYFSLNEIKKIEEEFKNAEHSDY